MVPRHRLAFEYHALGLGIDDLIDRARRKVPAIVEADLRIADDGDLLPLRQIAELIDDDERCRRRVLAEGRKCHRCQGQSKPNCALHEYPHHFGRQDGPFTRLRQVG